MVGVQTPPSAAQQAGASRWGGSSSERQGVQEELVDDGRWRHQVFQLQVEDALETQGADLPQFYQGTQDLGLRGLQGLSLTLVVFQAACDLVA